MGVIRGVLLVIVCVLFFLAAIAGGITLSLTYSLSYENVKPEVVSLLNNVLKDKIDINDKLTASLPVIETYCKTNSEYIFNYESYSLTIPCEVLMQGSDAVVDYGVGKLIDEYYYKDYNCDFWSCFGEDVPLFLISQKAQDYWQAKFYFFLVAGLILTGVMFLLVKRKSNMALLAGILLIAASLVLLKLESIASAITGSFLGDLNIYVLQILPVFFSQSIAVFSRFLIAGIVLVAVAIIMKIFRVGFVISNFIGKFRKREKPAEKPEQKSREKAEKIIEKPKEKPAKKKGK